MPAARSVTATTSTSTGRSRLSQYQAPPPAPPRISSNTTHFTERPPLVFSGSRSMRRADKSFIESVTVWLPLETWHGMRTKGEAQLVLGDYPLEDVVRGGAGSTRGGYWRVFCLDRSNQGVGGSGESPPSFARPVCWMARRRTNSICPLRLRRSSLAQRWSDASRQGRHEGETAFVQQGGRFQFDIIWISRVTGGNKQPWLRGLRACADCSSRWGSVWIVGRVCAFPGP